MNLCVLPLLYSLLSFHHHRESCLPLHQGSQTCVQISCLMRECVYFASLMSQPHVRSGQRLRWSSWKWGWQQRRYVHTYGRWGIPKSWWPEIMILWRHTYVRIGLKFSLAYLWPCFVFQLTNVTLSTFTHCCIYVGRVRQKKWRVRFHFE